MLCKTIIQQHSFDLLVLIVLNLCWEKKTFHSCTNSSLKWWDHSSAEQKRFVCSKHEDLSWPQKCFCMCVQKTAGVQTHGWAASWRILGMHLIINESTSDLLYIKETVETKMNIFHTQSLTLVKYVSVKHLRGLLTSCVWFSSFLHVSVSNLVNIAFKSTQTPPYLWKILTFFVNSASDFCVVLLFFCVDKLLPAQEVLSLQYRRVPALPPNGRRQLSLQ